MRIFRLFTMFLLLFMFFVGTTRAVSAQEPSDQSLPHFRAQVTKIIEESTIKQAEQTFFVQKVELYRLDTQTTTELTIGNEFQPLNANQRVSVGKTLIVAEQTMQDGSTQLVVVDVYRLPTVFLLTIAFALVVIIVAKWQGLRALLGMGISIIVLIAFIVPQIVAGQDPILISLIGSLGIASVTMYLSHGWSLKSHIALAAMLSTLVIVAVMAQSSVRTAQLVGLGSEEAYFLQFGPTANINLQGLLLGGIILGALGVLDDIAVSQVSIVFQLRSVKKEIEYSELYTRALAVGKDHVASLANTLALAYTGANLPLFILFILNQQIPHWVTLNSDVIVEEIVRTLTGSIGLVLAVPLTTAIAAFFALRAPIEKHSEGHKH